MVEMQKPTRRYEYESAAQALNYFAVCDVRK